jgi:hypothetical protein
LCSASAAQTDAMLGAPKGTTPMQTNDTVVVYDRALALDELRQRKAGAAGDRAHERAAAEQRQIIEEKAVAEDRRSPSKSV